MTTTSRISKIITWSAITVLLVVLLVKAVFIGYYRIPQDGMFPGLPAGSLLFTAKRAYSAPSQVKRGHIIVFVRQQNGQPYTYIWRVIGLPGDTVAAVGESLVINGQPVTRERVREDQGAVIFRERAGNAVYEVAFGQSPKQRPPDASVTVPSDHFFMMGDNRFDAYDSRYFGSVAFSTIVGRQL